MMFHVLGWLRYRVCSTVTFQNSEHASSEYRKPYSRLNADDLWIIDPIWLLIPPLPSAGLDNRDLYALGGVFTDESALELARGGGKDSGPSAGDEGRVLVPSWDPGKSLHSISSSTRWE